MAEHCGGEVDQGELDLRLELAHLARQYAGAAASVEDLGAGAQHGAQVCKHRVLRARPCQAQPQLAELLIAVSDTVVDGRDIAVGGAVEQLGVGEERGCALLFAGIAR